MPPTNHLVGAMHNSQQYVTLPGGTSTPRFSGSSSSCSSNNNSITARHSIQLGDAAVAGPPVMQLQGASCSQYAPQVYLNAQDLVLKQQQQDIAGASAAAAGTLLQLQSRLPSRGGVCMLVQCPPPSQPSTLQGGLMPGLVYSAPGGCSLSGSVLGSGVMPSAGHNITAGPLGMPLLSASALQQQGQQQHAWVHPMGAPAITLVSQYGPPAQLSRPVAVMKTDGLVLSSGSLLLPEPTGVAFSSSSNSNSSSSIPPLQFAAPGTAVCSAPANITGGFEGVLASDYASVAAALAQEKLAQMQELETQQERLRQDVITLLPYMQPGSL